MMCISRNFLQEKHPEELLFLLQHKFVVEDSDGFLISTKSDKPLLLEEIDAIILWVKQQLV